MNQTNRNLVNDKKTVAIKMSQNMKNSNGVEIEHKNSVVSEEITSMKNKVGKVDAKWVASGRNKRK